MKRFFAMMIAVAMLLGAAACAETYTLKLGSNTATTHPENVYARYLSDLVKEATNGDVIIEVYDNATLGDHLERQEGLRMGTIDATLTSIGYLGGYDPVFNIFEMPYLFADEAHQRRVFESEVFDMIADSAIQYGFVLVDALEMGARHITNSVRPIEKPEDLAGLKLRVPETTSSIDGMTAMGGTPTPLAFSELYMALQQKQVDGQENPLSNISASKFYEVQEYLSLTGHQRIEQVLLFSEITWNKLPEEYRTIIYECADEANDMIKEVVAAEETELLAEMEGFGVKINEVDVDAFMEKVKPLRDKYIELYGESAQTYYDLIDSMK